MIWSCLQGCWIHSKCLQRPRLLHGKQGKGTSFLAQSVWVCVDLCLSCWGWGLVWKEGAKPPLVVGFPSIGLVVVLHSLLGRSELRKSTQICFHLRHLLRISPLCSQRRYSWCVSLWLFCDYQNLHGAFIVPGDLCLCLFVASELWLLPARAQRGKAKAGFIQDRRELVLWIFTGAFTSVWQCHNQP